jgi:hypothetical protein
MRPTNLLFVLALAACKTQPFPSNDPASASQATSTDPNQSTDPNETGTSNVPGLACKPIDQPVPSQWPEGSPAALHWEDGNACVHVQIDVDRSAVPYLDAIRAALAHYTPLPCGGVCFGDPDVDDFAPHHASGAILFIARDELDMPQVSVTNFFASSSGAIVEADVGLPQLEGPLDDYLRLRIGTALGLDIHDWDDYSDHDVMESLCHVYGETPWCPPL